MSARRSSAVSMLAVALLGGAMSVGCARAQASVVLEPTPLEVPPPPPRVVDPVLAAEVEPPEEPVDATQIATTPPQPPPRPPSNRAEARSAEPAAAPPASPTAPSPGTTLQTLPADAERRVQRSVRANLDGALANLNRVDYQLLGADARVNYDQARRFINQAEEALRSRNFVFAATVADKAATLASELARR